MSGRARRSPLLRVLEVAGVGVVIVLALVAILTALRTDPPRSPGVMSDAVGPESGEQVDDYLARAAATLSAVGGPGGPDGTPGPDAPRWALVSAESPWTIAEAGVAVRQLPRVSVLYLQIPVDGVAMPVTSATLAEPVAGETGREGVFERGIGRAVDRLDADAPGVGTAAPPDDVPAPVTDDRVAATTALTVSRIREGDPAIIGMLVRGTTGQLRAVAEHPGVRVVEALPTDAVWGRFAARPLLPQQIHEASPLPDSAPVPAR